jgi:hypothetical protein
LSRLVSGTVETATWNAVGGPGEVVPAPGSLVVRQSQAVHAQVAQLLASLRTLSPPAPGAPRMVLRTYRLKSASPDDLAQVIPKLVAPDSWAVAGIPLAVRDGVASREAEAGEGTDAAPPPGAGGWLLIRQTPTVHDQIERLLGQMGIGVGFGAGQ